MTEDLEVRGIDSFEASWAQLLATVGEGLKAPEG